MSSSFQSKLRDWKIDRRRFLYATGGLAGLVATSRLQALAHTGTPSFPSNPFTLGVASGDPAPDSIVLWTRLALEPLAADGNGGMDPVRVPVRWIVAADDRMRHVVRRGVTFADPDFAHSVHVDVDRLSPGRPYWYQFHAGGEWSPVGRTRTSNSFWESPRRLRFAFASCQHFEQGFYTAYQHMAGEDLDLVLFLGDYIYEDGVSPTLPRQHDGDEPMTLGAYRNRHAVYKSDPYLQATHAAFPWLVVFDDHEVENNWAGPFDQNGTAPELFLPRRAAGVPGLLRAHAASRPIHPARAGHPAVPADPVRRSGRVQHARHPPVPRRSGLRRRHRHRLRGSARPESHHHRARAGAVAAQGAGPLASAVERDRPAGLHGAARLRSRRAQATEHGRMGRLRGVARSRPRAREAAHASTTSSCSRATCTPTTRPSSRRTSTTRRRTRSGRSSWARRSARAATASTCPRAPRWCWLRTRTSSS